MPINILLVIILRKEKENELLKGKYKVVCIYIIK